MLKNIHFINYENKNCKIVIRMNGYKWLIFKLFSKCLFWIKQLYYLPSIFMSKWPSVQFGLIHSNKRCVSSTWVRFLSLSIWKDLSTIVVINMILSIRMEERRWLTLSLSTPSGHGILRLSFVYGLYILKWREECNFFAIIACLLQTIAEWGNHWYSCDARLKIRPIDK